MSKNLSYQLTDDGYKASMAMTKMFTKATSQVFKHFLKSINGVVYLMQLTDDESLTPSDIQEGLTSLIGLNYVVKNALNTKKKTPEAKAPRV